MLAWGEQKGHRGAGQCWGNAKVAGMSPLPSRFGDSASSLRSSSTMLGFSPPRCLAGSPGDERHCRNVAGGLGVRMARLELVSFTSAWGMCHISPHAACWWTGHAGG